MRMVTNIRKISGLLPVLRIRDIYPRIQIFLSIPDPGSRIPDPKTATKVRGWKNLLPYLFSQPQMSQNWKLIFFWTGEEKHMVQFIKNYRTFYKLPLSSQKYRFGIWGSRKKPIPDPRSRVKKAPDPGTATVIVADENSIQLHAENLPD